MMFHLHSDALEFRAVHASVFDKIQTAHYLLKVDDFSDELHRQALTLLEVAHTECVTTVNYCQNSIENTRLVTNASLEAEIRLHQVRYWLLAHGVSMQLRDMGLSKPVSDYKVQDTDLLSSLERTDSLAQHYPSTCRQFQKVVSNYRGLLAEAGKLSDNSASSNSDASSTNTDAKSMVYVKRIADLEHRGAHDVERTWREHKLGSLTMCTALHPYSKEAFPEYCPECGKWEESDSEKTARAKKHLFDAEFLTAMKKLDTGSDTGSK